MGGWYISRVARLLAGLLLALATAPWVGCGYSLVGAGLGGASSVAVRTPQNDSFQAGLDLIVADALRRELLRRDGRALSENPAHADLVVSGRILPIATSAQSLSSAILALEHEVTLALELEATRRDGTKIRLAGASMRETERYRTSADIEAQRKNREEALRRLAGVLATRFFDAVDEGVQP
jgi:hypothetical protein